MLQLLYRQRRLTYIIVTAEGDCWVKTVFILFPVKTPCSIHKLTDHKKGALRQQAVDNNMA